MFKHFIPLLLSFSLIAELKEIPNQTKLKILTPEFSQMTTQRILLDNGLQAYLVSDPQLQESGAVLSVNVGSWDEPLDHPGLAHFLEHMLFMGTKKFPQENEYIQYLSEHGGLYNAYTDAKQTAFLFTIHNDHFPSALDRFSQFFKEPLFDPSSISRELKAINQEYSKNIEDDNFREYYILKSLSDPSHPFSHFDMGNIESLKNTSRDDLIAWYGTHYSSDLMRLIVFSSLPMEQLSSLVQQEFNEIPKQAHPIPKILSEAIPPSLKGHLLKIRPLKDLQTISVSWELPEKFQKMQDSLPASLVGDVIGDEGPGSLLALLKAENLAEGLSIGTQPLGDSSLLFTVEISLTKQGAQNPLPVLEYLFREIALLKDKGIPKSVFDDLQQIQTVNYQQQSRRDLFNQLFSLSFLVSKEELSSFPEKSYVIQSYDPVAINEVIQLLSPQNAVYILKIPEYKHEAMKSEKWLGGEYTLEALPETLLNTWTHVSLEPRLHLPETNPFIPRQLQVLDVNSADFPSPIKAYESDYGRVYYAADTNFRVPKVSIEYIIHTPKITLKNARSIVLADMYVKAATDALKELTYPAQRAGLSFDIHRVDDTIRISLNGFNDKALAFMNTAIEALKTLSIPDSRFEQIQNELERDYQNASKDVAIRQALELFKSAVYKYYPTNAQKYTASKKITSKHLALFTKHMFNRFYVEGMIYGNISENDSVKMTESLVTHLGLEPYPRDKQTKPEIISFLNQEAPLILDRKINVEGNASILGIDFGTATPRALAILQIVDRAMHEPFFDELRTKQQTGYIVFNNFKELEHNLFSLFGVQSTTHSPRDLLARYELFLENYLQNIKERLPQNRFDNIKNALITSLKQGPKNYAEMGDLLEKLAFDHDDDFKWIQKRIQALQDLTYEQFLVEAERYLGKKNKGRLAINVTGNELDPHLINYRTVRNLTRAQ